LGIGLGIDYSSCRIREMRGEFGAKVRKIPQFFLR